MISYLLHLFTYMYILYLKIYNYKQFIIIIIKYYYQQYYFYNTFVLNCFIYDDICDDSLFLLITSLLPMQSFQALRSGNRRCDWKRLLWTSQKGIVYYFVPANSILPKESKLNKHIVKDTKGHSKILIILIMHSLYLQIHLSESQIE